MRITDPYVVKKDAYPLKGCQQALTMMCSACQCMVVERVDSRKNAKDERTVSGCNRGFWISNGIWNWV